MTKKSGLGRGLDALIGSDGVMSGSSLVELPIHSITPNPRQPRNSYNHDELESLSESIRGHGVIQPIVVTHSHGISEDYILISGERRLLAAKRAGLVSIPAIVRDASDEQRLVLALIENLQRSDLNPLEEAEAYRQLAEEFNLTHEEIAQQVGKSREDVTNTLRLLKLSNKVQEGVVSD